MAKFWVLLLLATVFQKIACSRENAFVPMQSRSSHIDSSEFIDDNRMGSKSIDNTLRKVQKQHFQNYERRKLPGGFNENIKTVFYIGPEKGLTLFNTTLKSPISETDGTQAEESFTDFPQARQPLQRRLERKLNKVFNKFIFLQRPTEAQPLAKPGNKGFVFPDQLYIDSEPKCEESVREGKPFCTKVTNYPPLNQLETILKNEFSKFEVFFNEDLPQPQNVTQRMNHEPDEEYLCTSIEKVIYPEAAITKNSTWMLIVNNHENYKQGVRIEECLNEGEMCHVVQFPNHYKATCKQSFIYRSLVAITPNGTITKDHFKMPSCCKCVLRQVH